MIDDEVVSFSYSYTVVIYVRTWFLCGLHLYVNLSLLGKTLKVAEVSVDLAIFFHSFQHKHTNQLCLFERFAFVFLLYYWFELRINRLNAINAPARSLILP